ADGADPSGDPVVRGLRGGGGAGRQPGAGADERDLQLAVRDAGARHRRSTGNGDPGDLGRLHAADPAASARSEGGPAMTDPGLRRAGNRVFAAGVVLLVIWVLFPIYLLMVNALSAPAEVTAFPKRFWPSFDLASLNFFLQFEGVTRALWNSVRVAAVTMVLAIGLGAPAGYALSR